MAEIIIPPDNTLILPSDDRTREVPSIVTDDELTLRKFQLLPEEHPILKKEPLPWIFGENPDPQRMRLIMLENMVAHNGLGLSANQIGMPVKVFSMYVTNEEGIVCFNPKITRESNEKVIMKEGCLSFPGLVLKIKRPKAIAVTYQDQDGQTMLASFSDLSSRCFCHEMEHMDGENYLEGVNNLVLQSARKKQQNLLRRVRREVEGRSKHGTGKRRR